jgi:hypothetical protein
MDRPPSDTPTPYAELNGVLHDLVVGVRVALGDTFVGAYLQGSFAVGDFDEHSDADFVVATRSEPAAAQVAALQDLHARIHDRPAAWAQHLEGSYFPLGILRDRPAPGVLLWYLDHGSRSLVRSGHCNTLVVRAVLRERGIVLAGPPPATLVDPVPAAALRREIAATMLGWGREILRDPARWSNRFYQGYIVLNYSRMLHDLVRGVPGSKRAGAEWAKATFGGEWAGLIDRAWGGRPDPARAVREPADAAEFEQTLHFLRIVLEAAAGYAGRLRDE